MKNCEKMVRQVGPNEVKEFDLDQLKDAQRHHKIARRLDINPDKVPSFLVDDYLQDDTFLDELEAIVADPWQPPLAPDYQVRRAAPSHGPSPLPRCHCPWRAACSPCTPTCTDPYLAVTGTGGGRCSGALREF